MMTRTPFLSIGIGLALAPALLAASLESRAPLRIEAEGASATVIHVDLADLALPSPEALADWSPEGFTTLRLDGEYLLPRSSDLYEIPPTGGLRLVVEELHSEVLPGYAPTLGREDENGEIRPSIETPREAYEGLFREHIHLGEAAILRDLRLAPLSIQPLRVTENGMELLRSARIRLEYDRGVAGANELRQQHSWTSNMEEIYRGLVPNHGQFYNDVDDSRFPVYLITGADAYMNMAYIGEFVSWKRRKGFDVRMVPFSTIPGGNVNTIEYADLQAWFNQVWDTDRPEFILLVGDEDGLNACPTSYVQSSFGEQDVTDHKYALQEGEDYLPEILVGRMSVDNAQQLFTVARKPVVHESQTPIGTPPCEWHERGLVVSCNYADNGNAPISPNLTSRWVIEKMRSNGWCVETGDSLFYPPLSDGGPPVQAAINAGRNIVSYRGWANSNGWVFPAFDRNDIEGLTNGLRMPVVASFVCQTGAFGGAGVEDPCFGEKFVQFGNPATLGGAVAFVGPSDLHTRTQFNNPVCSGFFNAIFDLDLRSVGAALLNGKMELYRGYPLIRDDPYGAFFYFHVYNVLGDPDLKIWRGTPKTMSVEVTSELVTGHQDLEIVLQGDDGMPLTDAVVTITSGNANSELRARGRTDEQGRLVLPLELDDETTLTLTANHLEYVPGTASISVNDAAELAALVSTRIEEETADDLIRAGESLELFPTLENHGATELSALSAVLEADETMVEILDGNASWNTLAGGATAESADGFSLRILPSVPEGQLVPVVVRVTGGGDPITVIQLDVRNKALLVEEISLASGADHVDPGQEDELVLLVRAGGVADLAAAAVTLVSGSDRLEVIDTEAFDLGDLAVDGTAELRYTVAGGLSFFQGQEVPLTLQVVDGEGFSGQVSFSGPNGTEVPTGPLGPDRHGYYAIESGDFGIIDHPVYDWKELDPEYGGTFDERLYVIDDQVAEVDLPFDFTYYGNTYNRISVCSNGWISMGSTWMANFRNWNIPSSLGPPDMIMAWWDDLKPMYTAAGDSVHVPVLTRYDEAEGALILSWSRTYARYAWEDPGQPLQEFQLILYDQAVRPTTSGDNEFLMQYKRVTNVDVDNNYATVGITNFGHNDGLEVTYANFAAPTCTVPGQGSAILFTTEVPQNDPSISVNVLWPQPNDWFTPTQTVVRWDHQGLVERLGAATISYEVTLLDASLNSLWNTTVSDTGAVDVAAGLEGLPEGEGLSLRLRAVADGSIQVSALQGLIPVGIDRTAPGLSLALLENGLFLNTFELAIYCSEPMGSLNAVATGAGGEVEAMTLVPGSAVIGSGEEIYYLTVELGSDLSSIQISGEDLHGVPVSTDLPVGMAAGGSGELALEGGPLSLSWSGSESGQRSLLALPSLAQHPEAAAAHMVLQPENSVSQLHFAGQQGMLPARRADGRWLALEDGDAGPSLRGSGLVALVPAEQVEELPGSFRLHANWPNPFNPETTIRFDLAQAAPTRLVVYNLLGEVVRELLRADLEAGVHTLSWDGRDRNGLPQASGVYFARLESGPRNATIKMVLLR